MFVAPLKCVYTIVMLSLSNASLPYILSICV